MCITAFWLIVCYALIDRWLIAIEGFTEPPFSWRRKLHAKCFKFGYISILHAVCEDDFYF